MDRHLPGFLFGPASGGPADLMEDDMGGSDEAESICAGALRGVEELATKRLVLRRPMPADANAITAQANNAEVSRWLARMPHPYNRAHADTWIATVNAPQASECAFVITLAATGEIVGACGCGQMEDFDLPQLGYWIGQEHWGNGYATEAAHALIDHVFTASPCAVIGAGCRVANAASRRVIEKCGFQYAGLDMIESRFDGAVVPIFAFRLTRRTWQGLKSWAAA
ncbi:MAG: GNAT family N-acetyltransferase [Rhodobiaceae bacterium]|nr:GNAT family N-acetyltransferase [Rhodobiaceae bacterium]MCC0041159.1 GNAT family N-acetyltransferase [Rhodobiaceae bacterium]